MRLPQTAFAVPIIRSRCDLHYVQKVIDVNIRIDNGRTFGGMTRKHMPPPPVVDGDIKIRTEHKIP